MTMLLGGNFKTPAHGASCASAACDPSALYVLLFSKLGHVRCFTGLAAGSLLLQAPAAEAVDAASNARSPVRNRLQSDLDNAE